MPAFKKPVSLEVLAMRAVSLWIKDYGKLLVDIVSKIIKTVDQEKGSVFLNKHLSIISELLHSNVPCYLFDKMASEVMKCISDLIQETAMLYLSSSTPIYFHRFWAAVSFTEVFAHSHLKTLNFKQWPKSMRHVINLNLHKLKGLEELHIGASAEDWGISELRKNILSGVQIMVNLTSLICYIGCTDDILVMVGKNCPHIQIIDVAFSRSVTNRSIPALTNCNKLSVLNLYQTSVNVEGYVLVLQFFKSLQNIGRCDFFYKVLEKINKNAVGTLLLKSLQAANFVSVVHLGLLVGICPYLTNLTLSFEENNVDVTVLNELNNLKELKLFCCDFNKSKIKNLFKDIGHSITLIHLENVNAISISSLACIGQYCPRLKSLLLIHCTFVSNNNINPNPRYFKTLPFIKLEKLVCVACTLEVVEFILTFSVNIQFIHLRYSIEINDKIIARIFEKNQMKLLEVFYVTHSIGLTMRTVQLLMSCDHLYAISSLKNWVFISPQELEDFRCYIKSNNLDLDTNYKDLELY